MSGDSTSGVAEPNSPPSAAAVEVAGLAYTYPGRDRPTLVDVSFQLPRGSFTLITGATGSGKSTLLRALVGLIPNLAHGTMSGDVRIFGQSLAGLAPAATARLVGFVQQSPDDQICTTTVRAELAFGLENLNLPLEEIERRIAEIAARFRLLDELDRPTSQLSGGQKQRLILASVMAMRPPVLVCDEPLSRLDPDTAQHFLAELEQLRDAGTTIIVAEHRVDDVGPLADRILNLAAGRIDDRGASEDTSILCRSSILAPHSALLHADRLAFRFAKAPNSLWSDVSFSVGVGERIALVGPNGSGKSTLLAALAGELKLHAGQLVWYDASPQPATVLVPQEVDLSLFCSTVFAELAYAPRRQRLGSLQVEERVKSVAVLLGLEELLEEPPFALSRGQRVRTALAAALTAAPRLLLLDEPSTGQDAPTLTTVMDALTACLGAAGGPQALLFSTHDRRLAEHYADRVFLLQEGQLQENVPAARWFASPTRKERP